MRVRSWGRRAGWGLLAAALLSGGVGLPPVAASGARAAGTALEAPEVGERPSGVLEPGGRWAVTLLTGEVVDVASDADGRVTAQVREPHGPYSTRRMPDGDLLILPRSVGPLLGSVLDLDLFDVTGLVRQGYDDAGTDVVPLIVQRPEGADVRRALVAGPDETPLPSIGAVALEVGKGDAVATGDLLSGLVPQAGGEASAQSVAGITRIHLDGRVETTHAAAPARPAGAAQAAPLDRNLTQIGADTAWAEGVTGAGTTVAVLDTGVDGTHPDLAGQVVGEQDFSDAADAVDRDGHGTHVAGTIAGTGAAAGGARRGVAPDADLLSGKVLDDFGFGSFSSVIAGMEWAAPRADVVNMSLGSATDGAGPDPVAEAVDRLTEQHGALFVISAGNDGPGWSTIGTPGVAEQALTVGAVDGDDAVADFSSRGPVPNGYALKPELVAPGVGIVAPLAAGTLPGEPVGDLYVRLSGTSMAAPHAAGAAALVAQRHPDWTGDQLKRSLVGATDALDGDAYDVGAGRLDAADALASPLLAGRDAVEAQLVAPRTEAHTEELTWANTGAEPVTVQLAAALEGPDGEPVDAVEVSPAELTIEPGGTGTATLTVDGPGLENGFHGGSVTATVAGEGGATARTPVVVHATNELVELTVDITALAGIDPAMMHTDVLVVNLDDYDAFARFVGRSGPGQLTVSVPAGRYAVVGDAFSFHPDTNVVAQVGDPDVVIDGPKTVTLDAAAAVPLAPRVPGTEVAPPTSAEALVAITPERGADGQAVEVGSYSWYPSPPVRLTRMEGDPDHFRASQLFRLQAPHLTVTAGGEPVAATTGTGHRMPATGEHVLRAVDAGDGADLSGAAGALAVVRYPDGNPARAEVTHRAAEAGVAVLAFVDERDRVLTGGRSGQELWADVPLVFASGAGAASLVQAAAAGGDVTVAVQASPFVYDIQTPPAQAVDPEPVLDREARRQLARIDQRFHRDPDGAGSVTERRYKVATVMNLNTAGPLPAERTDWVTPDVEWQGVVASPAQYFLGEAENVGVSQDLTRSYAPRSRQESTWLRRPLWPAPVGGHPGNSFCQPPPPARGPDVMHLWLTAFQDEAGRYGCGMPDTATTTLERDGEPIAALPKDPWFSLPGAEFPVPAEPGAYRLVHEQEARMPYAHRSSTAWTFASEAPDGEGEEPIPLLVVDYDLPLGTDNAPTGRTATLTIAPVTGSEAGEVSRPQVWTSTDDGATWAVAPVRAGSGEAWRVTLPRVPDGTGVSLRVDASEATGGRIEQTLIDAYAG